MGPERRAGTGTNQEAVRRHNLGTLLRHVHRSGQMSRAELTSVMGLNRSTIGGLVAELESLGVTTQATPTGPGQRAGRPSTGVRLAPDGPYVVAVDLGVDRIVAARVSLGGLIGQRQTAPIPEGSDPREVADVVADLVRGIVAGADTPAPLLGIGISVPGLIRRHDGLVRLAPNLAWRDVAFGPLLRDALDLEVPVLVANDADLGALAEHERGAGVGINDLIYVSGNVGVGAGVITSGVRLEGAGGYAGEVGHLQFNPTGQVCHCGNTGCWETEVGGPAIAAAIGVPLDQVASLVELLDGHDEPTPALREIGHSLGQGLAGLVNAFNPTVVVLGGYFRALYRLVGAEVSAALAEHALPAPLESVTVSLPGLDDDSVLLGAAEMALEPVFADPVAGLAGASGAGLVDLGLDAG